jgi:hypothetical protein
MEGPRKRGLLDTSRPIEIDLLNQSYSDPYSRAAKENIPRGPRARNDKLPGHVEVHIRNFQGASIDALIGFILRKTHVRLTDVIE